MARTTLPTVTLMVDGRPADLGVHPVPADQRRQRWARAAGVTSSSSAARIRRSAVGACSWSGQRRR